MYCRNCGNEVNEKAVACPKCGFNPRSEKKFCPTCGVDTDPKQVVCIKCGVSLAKSFSIDTGSLPKIDVQSFLKNKASVAASVALLACFMPWISITMYYSKSISLFGISKLTEYAPDTILVPFFIYLFPLSLLGFILSDYVPQITKYKKLLSISSLVLLAYISLGLILAANPSTPDVSKELEGMGINSNQLGEVGDLAKETMKAAQDVVDDFVSIGFGFYLAIIATIASFVLYIKQK